MVTKEQFEEICNGIANGNSLRSQLSKFSINPRMFYLFVDSSPEYSKQYARSIDVGCDSMADDIQSIADEPVPMTDRGLDGAAVQQNRLRVDARKWLLSKRMPKKYGDRIEQEVTHNFPTKVVVEYI